MVMIWIRYGLCPDIFTIKGIGMAKMSKDISKKKLCLRCKKHPRKSLTMCSSCLDKHNKQTKRFKHKLKSQGRCVNCGKTSNKYICDTCQKKQTNSYKKSTYLATRKRKNIIKEIMELIL